MREASQAEGRGFEPRLPLLFGPSENPARSTSYLQFFYAVNKDYALEELAGLMRFIVFRVLIFGT